MVKHKLLLFLLAGVWNVVLRSPETQAWQVTIDGGAKGPDFAEALAMDNDGNVAAAGVIDTTTGQDAFVVKRSGVDGHELWHVALSGTAGTVDEAPAVAVDDAGNVVAVATIRNTSP